MSMSVETAIVSKRGSAKDFNTDFINASGKLWPNQIVHGEKGVRAAGTGNGRPYYVLASSAKKGTAESAAGLFETCVEKFTEDGSNTALLMADYLKAFSRVLNETGFVSSDCSCAMLSGFNDTVYVAKAGNNRLYTFYDDTFMEIKPQQTQFADEKSSFGVAQCNHVKEGDIFILLSGAVSASLPEGILPAICKSAAGDVKKIVSLIASQAVKFGCKDAISAVVIKIQSVEPAAEEEPAPEAITAAAATPDEQEFDTTEQTVSEEDDTEEKEVQTSEEAAPDSKGKRAVRLIAILVVACAVIAGALFGIKFWSESHDNPAANSTLDPSSVSASVSVSESQSASKTTQKTTETSTTKPTTTEPSSESASVTDSTTAAPTERYTSTTRSTGYDYEDETEEEPATTPVEDEPTEPTSQEEPTQSSENPESTDSEPTENDNEENTPVEPSDE